MSDSWSDKLVSTDWVAQHKDDAGVRLVEVDVDVNAYAEGHIDGAVGWNWTTELQDRRRRDILGRDDFEALMRRSGIKKDDLVILYGDNNNWFAAYAYWQLQLYGHTAVKLMDGGRKKWIDEGRTVSTDVPTVQASDYVADEPDMTYRAFQHDVLQVLGRSGQALVDVRSPAEFTGEVLAPPGLNETAQRGGHIPGAVNVPWSKAVREDGTFKSKDELKELYGNLDVTEDKDVIAYCRIGERSSHTWFVLHELLGFKNVRNYDGSWTEWGSMVGTPIER